ncbi:MAG: hypothetical protein NUV55_07095 [Sulfuricaulis sp.]|uniref:hypothetical protein n=1 Tax=Sulfuricaulis sp. TaxID=2003553 RepID=UPI0025EF6EC6|nr:hypothetical protein [Sulfuricaulis sp.]MCR4346952.1 hypothetical protein [Sulfuricaulis sp.]
MKSQVEQGLVGSFVAFKCKFCQYEEPGISVGRGKAEMPFLALYRCNHCLTIGSTWVHEGKIPRCANCYDDAIVVMPDDTRRVNCPKCGEPAVITPKEGSWE